MECRSIGVLKSLRILLICIDKLAIRNVVNPSIRVSFGFQTCYEINKLVFCVS